MPVSTSKNTVLLPLAVIMGTHKHTCAHACATNSCIIRSVSVASCAEKFPLRKHRGGGRVVDEML